MFERILNACFNSDFIVFVLPDRVIVRKVRRGLASLVFRESTLEYSYSHQTELPRILEMAGKSLSSQPSDRWFLGLPLKYFTLVNLTLPRAAQENLDEAVKYALMRHVPYDLEHAHLNYDKSLRQDYLDISAMVIPKDSIKPYLKAASAAGVTLHSTFPSILYWARLKGDGVYLSMGDGYGEVMVHIQDRIVLQNWGQHRAKNDHSFLEESSRLLSNIPNLPSSLYIWQGAEKNEYICSALGVNPEKAKFLDFQASDGQKQVLNLSRGYEINLLPAWIVKQQKLKSYFIYGGVLFVAVCILVVPVSKLAGQKRHLTKIEKKIEDIQEQAEDLHSLREQSRRTMDNLESIAEMKKAYPSVISVLSELTRAVPETAWVHSMTFSDNTVTIQGEAESATSVMESVENSAVFSEVRFSSPVTKSGNYERFAMVAKVSI
ncbi:PilN domain-containing protein [Desulfonatronospira sp.]|uniref:PilN domain-containing protein n=1 Tax=Desulfonatronospira sp. TaxID=1962951 RepID=UPI0025BA583C|nr:PilN domain-containing protein [Desulfonatronospira sp.]